MDVSTYPVLEEPEGLHCDQPRYTHPYLTVYVFDSLKEKCLSTHSFICVVTLKHLKTFYLSPDVWLSLIPVVEILIPVDYPIFVR